MNDGSCGSTVLVINNSLYAINLGDSWIICSINNGKQTKAITIDHKPSELNEFKWII